MVSRTKVTCYLVIREDTSRKGIEAGPKSVDFMQWIRELLIRTKTSRLFVKADMLQ
jgi:hypothetical protein